MNKLLNDRKQENRFATIREFLEPFLDMIGIQCFKMVLDGQCYASNSKGRNARISISLPKTVIDKNLKDLDKFVFIGIAIPRKFIDIKQNDIDNVKVIINQKECKHIITLKNGNKIEV